MKRWNQVTLPLLAAVCASLTADGFEFFEPVRPPRAFQVMAHRGMMRQAPENTRPALERVIEDGLEWAEVLENLGEHYEAAELRLHLGRKQGNRSHQGVGEERQLFLTPRR